MINVKERKQNILSQTIQKHHAEAKVIMPEAYHSPIYVLVHLDDPKNPPIRGNFGESLVDLVSRVGWLAQDSDGKYYIPED